MIDTIVADLSKKAFGGRACRPILGKSDKVPQIWQPYLQAEQSNRLRELESEFAILKEYMPLAVDGLMRVATDIIVVDVDGYGIARTIVRIVPDDSKFYHAVSYPPKPSLHLDPAWELFASHAPTGLVRIYTELFDGLTDAHEFCGPKRLHSMKQLDNSPDTYEDWPPDHEIYSTKYSTNVIEIFSSGGGGYFYLDLNKDQRFVENPEGILLLIGEGAEFSPHKPFWDYLDQWTSIGLSGE